MRKIQASCRKIGTWFSEKHDKDGIYCILEYMKKTTPEPPAKGRTSRGTKARPNVVHPGVPGAVGSRESPYSEGRDQAADSRLIIEDAVKRITGGSKEQ